MRTITYSLGRREVGEVRRNDEWPEWQGSDDTWNYGRVDDPTDKAIRVVPKQGAQSR